MFNPKPKAASGGADAMGGGLQPGSKLQSRQSKSGHQLFGPNRNDGLQIRDYSTGPERQESSIVNLTTESLNR